jgi:heme exporter protein A
MSPAPPVFRSPAPAAAPDGAVFTGRDLVCLRGDRVVFAGLDFTLGAGAALLLLGRNGSGKSSLLRLMAGLLRPAAGALDWHGAPVLHDREAHGARVRYIGHHDAIKPVLTVAENIAFWVRAWAPQVADVEAAVRGALVRLDMERLAEVPGKMLSAGQKRRTNLARLLAAPADLWLLDEPTTALDKASIAVLEDAIADHRATGGMVALSTHAEVALPAARTLRMEDFAAAADALDTEWAVAEGGEED